MATILPQPPGADDPGQSAARPDPGAAKSPTANEREMWQILDVVSRCVRPGSDFLECLDSVLRAAMKITSAGAGSLRLWDRETGVLKVVRRYGLDAALIEKFDSLRQDEASSYGIAINSGERTIVEDIALTDVPWAPELISSLLAAGIRAFQSTPLVTTSGVVVGVVSTHFFSPRRPAPRELRFLDSLALQAADYVERVQAERALQRRTEQFEALLRNAPLGIFLVDSSFRVRHANPTALQIFAGLTGIFDRNFEELMQSTWNREYADGIARECRRTLLTGDPCTLHEERACRIGRQEREYYEWRIHRIDLPEEVHGIVCYFRDISASIAARIKIRDHEEKLRRVVRLAAAGQLASSLAHEINNPLASITNVLYLLGDHPALQPAVRDLVRTATTELERVSRIVRQSLSYYHSGSVLNELDLSALVEERLAIFAEQFAASGVEVNRTIAEQARTVGFAEEIRQAIDNLLANALEAMPKGGRLAIKVRKSRTWKNHGQPGVRLTIADTGCGIPVENQGRIFDAFFTTKAERGRGLGLWVVRGIVAKHEGSLSLRSRQQPGRSGTVVSIVWPVTMAQYGAPPIEQPGAAA